jgi:large-conductance mechanosensitive channel
MNLDTLEQTLDPILNPIIDPIATTLYQPVIYFKDFSKSVLAKATEGYLDFLLSKNILQVGVAFIISTRINGIATVFVDTIVSPIVHLFLPGDTAKTLDDKKIVIGSLQLSFGKLISEIIKFILITMILYYFVIYAVENKLLKKLK